MSASRKHPYIARRQDGVIIPYILGMVVLLMAMTTVIELNSKLLYNQIALNNYLSTQASADRVVLLLRARATDGDKDGIVEPPSPGAGLTLPPSIKPSVDAWGNAFTYCGFDGGEDSAGYDGLLPGAVDIVAGATRMVRVLSRGGNAVLHTTCEGPLASGDVEAVAVY